MLLLSLQVSAGPFLRKEFNHLVVWSPNKLTDHFFFSHWMDCFESFIDDESFHCHLWKAGRANDTYSGTLSIGCSAKEYVMTGGIFFFPFCLYGKYNHFWKAFFDVSREVEVSLFLTHWYLCFPKSLLPILHLSFNITSFRQTPKIPTIGEGTGREAWYFSLPQTRGPCICFLLLYNKFLHIYKLKTTHFYHRPVSMEQQSELHPLLRIS